MLSSHPFYHKNIKKAIIAFGSLFSDVKIIRSNADGSDTQTIMVPIAQAPKEKWLVRIESDPNLENHTYITLPRMSFEITGLSYDPSRRVNRLNKIACIGPDGKAAATYSPVPYNLDISLYILTKTQEDAFQIVEQILPYFTPEFTLGVRAIEEPDVIVDIPIILNSVSLQDDYDGDFETRRFVTYTLTFTMKLNLFGEVDTNKGVITKTIVQIGTNDNRFVDPEQEVTIINTGNPATGEIIEQKMFTYELSSNPHDSGNDPY